MSKDFKKMPAEKYFAGAPAGYMENMAVSSDTFLKSRWVYEKPKYPIFVVPKNKGALNFYIASVLLDHGFEEDINLFYTKQMGRVSWEQLKQKESDVYNEILATVNTKERFCLLEAFFYE